MALVTDIWQANGWTVMDLQEAVVERMEFKPQLLGRLDIFEPVYSRSKTIGIVDREGTLALVPTSERGAPPVEHVPEGARIRPFQVNRLAKGSTIMADELSDILALPFERQIAQVASEVARRGAAIIDDVELTHEHMRLGAVMGRVLDADGVTVLIDWYEAWGRPEPTEINFALGTASTDVRKLCRDVKRRMQVAAKGVWTPNSRVGALVGDTFYDSLVNHPSVKELKLGTEGAAALEDVEGYSSIEIEGITWINYQGADIDTGKSSLAIGTDQARFFPMRTRGAFQMGFGPANEFKPYLGEPGREYFSMLLEDTSGRAAWDRVEVYSYPLAICTRPDMLQRARGR